MSDYPDTPNSSGAVEPAADRRAYPLAVVGLLAGSVAGWGLAGSPAIGFGPELGWIAIAVGLVVGLVLIVSGTRR